MWMKQLRNDSATFVDSFEEDLGKQAIAQAMKVASPTKLIEDCHASEDCRGAELRNFIVETNSKFQPCFAERSERQREKTLHLLATVCPLRLPKSSNT